MTDPAGLRNMTDDEQDEFAGDLAELAMSKLSANYIIAASTLMHASASILVTELPGARAIELFGLLHQFWTAEISEKFVPAIGEVQ